MPAVDEGLLEPNPFAASNPMDTPYGKELLRCCWTATAGLAEWTSGAFEKLLNLGVVGTKNQ